MNVCEAIKTRRSVRVFDQKAISVEDLTEILDCARWSPNASNQQAWRFVVITSQPVKQMLLRFAPGISDTPAAIILICAEEKKSYKEDKLVYMADCAIASQSIMLAAHELGIATCPILSFSKSAWREILEIPEEIELYLAVILGYPGEAPSPPERKDLDCIAFRETFGECWET